MARRGSFDLLANEWMYLSFFIHIKEIRAVVFTTVVVQLVPHDPMSDTEVSRSEGHMHTAQSHSHSPLPVNQRSK